MDLLRVGEDGRARCWWPGDLPEYVAYHDDEWGRPVHDDHRLFEKLCLEGFQSGLSWLTILRKRESFRRAFAGFDFHAVAGYGPQEVFRREVDFVQHTFAKRFATAGLPLRTGADPAYRNGNA